ncbi:septum formation protein Maf [Altererythrobacter confluentis]|uniref:Nucleoside triphosphate pyrophosphatase n=1 Tax=Allopontixanthobacter confluentis TaxID=1849021 RepID=A0A6L7GH37_9SPHN|nr:Maf family protein [Allopontixanthobacter confluentis]MXP15227.1 septum formation protein Maf [Allopontixanthobacter confluentis]
MIILASKSASRAAMLDAAGVAYEAVPANVDERGIEAGLAGQSCEDIALALAKAKAAALTNAYPGTLVLGSDSLVSVAGQRFDKPANRAAAAEHLRYFSGKTMHLHSAGALARDDAIVWQHAALATLQVRALSDEFIHAYLDAEWPEVSHCVGVFRIEAMGVQLFDAVDGDQFTVLGMPLLPLLGALRDAGELRA